METLSEVTIQELVAKIEPCAFECEAGPLTNNLHWRELTGRIADLERQLADMLPVVEAARFHERSVTFYSHGTSSDIYHCDVCAAYKAYEARKPK